MEALAQDLNSALEESTASSSHKRKSCWKRRKKRNEDDSFDYDDSSASSPPGVPRRSKTGQGRPRPKRKCKRKEPLKQTTKRKKIRTISSEMKCIRPGKRPRSTSSPMDLDEEDSSSSSLSCEEEEEDLEYEAEQRHSQQADEQFEELFEEDGGEVDDKGQDADDEQSDWPGINEDLDDESACGGRRLVSKLEARREILRSGTRKNLHSKGEECLISLNHQLTKFLRDSSRIEMRINARHSTERSKIVQFANLYSLNLKMEGLHRIRLTKTCNTLQFNSQDGLFLIPGAPSGASSTSLEFKRRRKTPPLFEPPCEDVKSPQVDISQSPASKRRTNCYEGSRSS